MKLFYSADCALHNPEFEILSGRPVTYLESPDRMSRIISHLKRDDRTKNWQWVDIDSDDANSSGRPIDASLAISKVHDSEYIQYLQHAYELWVQDGGSKASRLHLMVAHDVKSEPAYRQQFSRKCSHIRRCSLRQAKRLYDPKLFPHWRKQVYRLITGSRDRTITRAKACIVSILVAPSRQVSLKSSNKVIVDQFWL
jgi:acetoin utilization deacetylase AcuC-like enzyme